MTWLRFIAEITNALAWPIVVGGFLLVFRRPLAARIGSIKRAQAGSASIEFETGLALVAETVEALAAPVEANVPNAAEAEESALSAPNGLPLGLQHLGAAGVVSKAWDVVEAELLATAEMHGLRNLRPSDLPFITLFLEDKGVIDRELGASLRGLVLLRRMADHDAGAVSDGEARKYLGLSKRVVAALRRVQRPESPPPEERAQ